MKTIKLSLRDFSLPSPLSGSIDAHSGFGVSGLEGIELHQRVQKKRLQEDPRYKSEVKISQEFEREGYLFQVEGRMDGFYDHEVPHVEEIKSSFNIRELSKTLYEKNWEHTYYLQLLTYGYFVWKQIGKKPLLTLHLVSSRNQDSLDIKVKLDLERYELWLERRLKELVVESVRSEKRAKRRQKMSKEMDFPFDNPRRGQIELIETIEKGMKQNKRLMIQAPTGLGKTMGVMYPSLKESMGRGQKVIYVTPKNSQHTVAEEAVEKIQEKNIPIKSLTITAKSKLCMKAEPICNPEFCEYAKDYYDKFFKNELKEALFKKKKLTSRIFKQLGEKYKVCPFELQLAAVQEADVVICDYNYVFANRSALGRLPMVEFSQEGLPNLVVDEAHNLPARAMGYYSPALSSWILDKMKLEMKLLPKKIAKEGEELIEECIEIIKDLKPRNSQKASRINIQLNPFLEMEEKLRGFLSRYLDSEVEIKPKDVVIQLSFYWSEFTEILKQIADEEREEFFTTFHPSLTGGILKITCCDASEMIKPKYDNFQNVVNFSATLKPFEFYSRLSGLHDSNLKIEEFQSPFDKKNRKLLLIPQVSTKYSEREKNYSRIADAISKIASTKAGNYLVFFPSFEFMEQVHAQFKIHPSFYVMKQLRSMKNTDTEFYLEELKSQSKPIILFAVQGGVFSEGVDYPGEMVLGAFVIGPPLPQFDLERELMKDYYEKHYQEGFDYAYSYPAMAKAIQSAGRVIRSESDKGIIVLMDNRFLDKSYTKSMPLDWFEEGPQEMVSQSILKDINDFWNQF